MENRICRIFLRLVGLTLLMGAAQASYASEEMDVKETSPLIEPYIMRLDLDEAEIDTENFEVGLHWGQISVEDFGVNDLYAITGAFHVTEDFFIELAYADSEAQRPVEEGFAGGITLPGELDYNYYNLSLGVHVLPGEVFIWKDWAFNSQVYLIGGVGVTENVLGVKDTTFSVGAGYRLIILDWLALRFDVRDHIYERDEEVATALGENDQKVVHNIEVRAGVSFFF